jgi:hypothetical protein
MKPRPSPEEATNSTMPSDLEKKVFCYFTDEVAHDTGLNEI